MRLTSLAKPIGWFSLALGAAELLASRRIASAHGSPGSDNVVRGFGVREILSGVAVLARPNNPWPFVARAVGDLLDVGAAGLAARSAHGRSRTIALVSLAAVAGFFVLDSLVAREAARA